MGQLGRVNAIIFEKSLRNGIGRPGFNFCFSVTLSVCLNLCEPQIPHLEEDGHSDRKHR